MSILEKILERIEPASYESIKKKMLLAAKISKTISAKGWTKKEFAVRVGKRPSEITKWLSGTHNFTVDTLWEIETVLGIELISLNEKQSIKISHNSIRTMIIELKPAQKYNLPFGKRKSKVSTLKSKNTLKSYG